MGEWSTPPWTAEMASQALKRAFTGAGPRQSKQSNVCPLYSGPREVAVLFSLVSDVTGQTLDCLDYRELPAEIGRHNAAIAKSPVQGAPRKSRPPLDCLGRWR
jgi:hypothetical protein